jgi:hypothetical protein
MPVALTDTAPSFKDVTFTIDGVPVHATVGRAEFVPDQPNLDYRTIAGKRSGVAETSWTLEVEGLQDWFQAQNLAQFLSDHSGEDATVALTWTGSNGETTGRTATVVCKDPGWGGTADELATFSVSLPVNGAPTRSDSAGS